METILQTKNLFKIYEGSIPFTALNDITMTVESEDFVAIMGPSGSGKSTFLNVVSTIDKPSSGTVLVGGNDPFNMNDDQLATFRRETLGFVFQNFNLVDTLTIEENIMLPLSFTKTPVAEMKGKVRELAKMLGIEPLLGKRTYEISGGQAQRTAIARAVINHPALILADEPTGNLDSKSARDVMELFATLNKEQKATILMVTHDSFVASYAKRVLIIKDGRIYQCIDRGDSRSTFHQRIVDAMNLLGGNEYDAI